MGLGCKSPLRHWLDLSPPPSFETMRENRFCCADYAVSAGVEWIVVARDAAAHFVEETDLVSVGVMIASCFPVYEAPLSSASLR